MTEGNAAVWGALVSFAAAVLAVLLTQALGLVRERQSDMRALRDATRERIRGDYIKLLSAASVLADITHEAQFVHEGEDEERRNSGLSEELRLAFVDLNLSATRLELEGGTDEVRNAFRKAYSGFLLHQVDRSMSRQYPGTVPLEEIRRNKHQIQTGLTELRTAARAHLATLEEPIPRLPSGPQFRASAPTALTVGGTIFLAISFLVSEWARVSCSSPAGITSCFSRTIDSANVIASQWPYPLLCGIGLTLVWARWVTRPPLGKVAYWIGMVLVLFAIGWGLGVERMLYWTSRPDLRRLELAFVTEYRPLQGYWLAFVGAVMLPVASLWDRWLTKRAV